MIAVSTLVVGYCVFAPSALPKLWQMRTRENTLDAEIAALQKHTRDLSSQAALLSGTSPESRETIEQIARREHGLVAHDEVLLLLGPTKGSTVNHEKNIHP